MEPQIPNPNHTPNQSNFETNLPPVNPEHAPLSPENNNEQRVEQGELRQSRERLSQSATQAAPPATTLPQVTPSSVPPTDTADDATIVNPTTASDDDIIEKEWVNKAKKVVADTQGNPYLREKEVSKLQADYLQKRYGKQVKIPEDV